MSEAWALVQRHEKTDRYLVLAVALDRAFFCSPWFELSDVTKRARCSMKLRVGMLVRLDSMGAVFEEP